MLQDGKDGLLLSLANTLVGNRVETEPLARALALICDRFPFFCGLVYETDPSGHFCLLGQYEARPTTFPPILDTQALSPHDRGLLAQQDIHAITGSPQATPLEQQLLALTGAPSLVVAPVADGDGLLYGLVVLSADSPVCPGGQEGELLRAALSTLVRYVGMRMYQNKIVQAKNTMGSILDNTGIDIYVNDFETHEILYVNKSMAAPYGGQDQFEGKKCWQVLFPGQSGPCEFCPQNKLIDNDGLPTKVYTWDYERAFDGSWFRVFSAAFRWVDGRLAHVVSSADITDNKRNEALVANLANYDQLTKLPNRRMMLQECERHIDSATAIEQGYVMFFDIDGFKAINDQFGHDAGDEFLIQLGEFFSNIPLLKNSIFRNGGDEFVAVIGGEKVTKFHIQSLGNFIHGRFAKPWKLKKGTVWCNTSIGVACFPEDGTETEALLQKADMAMYQVKRSGGGGLCFGYQLEEAGVHKR